MLGYVHKDQGQPHFRVALHNIDNQEIVKGIAEWQAMKLSYEDDKIMITKANLFHRLSTYRLNTAPESDNNFLTDMTTLLNTNKYMVSTQFITTSGNIRLKSAEAMYKLVKGVQPLTSQDVTDLFFAPPFVQNKRPGAAVAGERYFDTDKAREPEPPSPLAQDLDADDGFLGHYNPDGPLPPATREGLSSFARRLITTPPTPARARPRSSPDSRAIRPNSPVSNDSGEHSSDREFIDDQDV